MAFTGNYTCNSFKTGLLNQVFNFTTGQFYIALYNNTATLNASTTAYTTTGEVVASGYTAGGNLLTITQTPVIGASSNIAYINFGNITWSAAITARGALIYQSGGGNPAVCVLDFGSDKVSTTSFTVQFPANGDTSAILRIA